MSARQENLTIEQGTTWTRGWSVVVSYDGVTFEPIDATWSARGQVRLTVNSPTVLHEFAALVDAAGNVMISVSAAESTAWAWVSGVYDVEIENSDASVTLRVAQGSVSVSREVTREPVVP